MKRTVVLLATLAVLLVTATRTQSEVFVRVGGGYGVAVIVIFVDQCYRRARKSRHCPDGQLEGLGSKEPTFAFHF